MIINVVDQATGEGQRLVELLRSGAPAQVGGRAIANVLREFFFNLGRERHRGYGPSFYAGVARSVQQPQEIPDGVKVAITHVGLAQRFFGGPIRMIDKLLAIPTPAAEGKSPREFDDLHFAPYHGPNTVGALVANRGTASVLEPKKNGGFKKVAEQFGETVLFWLAREVTQLPDPSVLPSERVLAEAAIEAMDRWIFREIQRSGGVA